MREQRSRAGELSFRALNVWTLLLLVITGGGLVSTVALGQVSATQGQATAAVAFGAIVGLVTDSTKAPIAGATVTARSSRGSIRATISGSDGVFSFADLPPGEWSLTLEAQGYLTVEAVPLQVLASKATRRDITMSGTSLARVPAAPAAPAIAAAAATPAASAARPAPAPAPTVPLALQAPPPGPAVDLITPFANEDIGWMNGTTRETTPIFDTNFFTPEVRFDVNYLQDFNHPVDHTIVGSTEEFRSGEFQLEQFSFGGNFHWNDVQARFLTMFGMYATTTPRNDASSAEFGGVGQWDLQDAYRYISEANAGYHWDVSHGLNVDAGIFLSYIGLFSYYNFDNWTYQPSFVSSNTPWFFNGLRIQWFPTQTLKIEPWLINGWQTYAKVNSHPGFGGQILWIPNENFKMVFNSYGIGEDNLASGSGVPNNGGSPTAAIGVPNPNGTYINYSEVTRIHEDDSLLWKYYDNHGSPGVAGITKQALSLTWDVGCEYGGGVHCASGPNKANFVGAMLYDRSWFDHDHLAMTLGGGFMNNPGRYLALLPPIDAATASTGSPYWTENPGQKLFQWDTQFNVQYMPKDWITWWTEATFRHSNVPYWAGPGGVTPPGGNNGSPADFVCSSGASAGTSALSQAYSACGPGGVWFPDLRTREIVWGAGVMVKF